MGLSHSELNRPVVFLAVLALVIIALARACFTRYLVDSAVTGAKSDILSRSSNKFPGLMSLRASSALCMNINAFYKLVIIFKVTLGR